MAHNIFNAYQRDTGNDVFCLENQKILERLTANHVYANVTELVEHLNEYIETLNDQDNGKVNRLIGKTDYFQAAEDEIREIIENEFDEFVNMTDVDHIASEMANRMVEDESCQAFCERRSVDLDHYTQDILAHFTVSDWLSRCLDIEGEAVEEIFNLRVWGRKTTGQDVKMDSVIARIAIKEGLLVGQAQHGEQQALAA